MNCWTSFTQVARQRWGGSYVASMDPIVHMAKQNTNEIRLRSLNRRALRQYVTRAGPHHANSSAKRNRTRSTAASASSTATATTAPRHKSAPADSADTGCRHGRRIRVLGHSFRLPHSSVHLQRSRGYCGGGKFFWRKVECIPAARYTH